MTNSEYITNESPRRAEIVKILDGKEMTAAQVGAVLGWTRDRTYAVLSKMHTAKLVGKLHKSKQTYWCKYKAPPKPIKRETPVLTGTMRGKLSLGYMTTVTRPGSMDAYAIASKGISA